MSNDVRIKLNSKGIQELLKSPEISAAVQEVCERIKTNAGSGYGSNVQTGKKRAVGRVYAATRKALSDNYKNNTLLKAMHG